MNNVKILYGNPVARELLEVELVDDAYKFKIHGLITNPNYSSKRMTLLLFINHRLVDSTRKLVKRSNDVIDQIFNLKNRSSLMLQLFERC